MPLGKREYQPEENMLDVQTQQHVIAGMNQQLPYSMVHSAPDQYLDYGDLQKADAWPMNMRPNRQAWSGEFAISAPSQTHINTLSQGQNSSFQAPPAAPAIWPQAFYPNIATDAQVRLGIQNEAAASHPLSPNASNGSRVLLRNPYVPSPQPGHATPASGAATSPSPHLLSNQAAYNFASSGNLLVPSYSNSSTLQVPRSFRATTPMNPDLDLKTPVSPVSPHHDSEAMELAGSRKRSHSVMSQQHDLQQQPHETHVMPLHHSRSASMASVAGLSQQGEDFVSPRGSRTLKRENPPTNADGKYWCNWAAAEPCYGQAFDRKCEWGKHMDKHDRPYRCQHKQCEKLQGFTYSGGLLRHQREVHGQHGGPKATLMCPMEGCRRHEGKGFTRKENLNEHLRRVHGVSEQQSQVSQQQQPSQYSMIDASLTQDEGVTPASRMSESLDLNGSGEAFGPGGIKRRRTDLDSNGFPIADPQDELRNEIQRLREELEQKDARIREIEAQSVEQDERIRQLQTALEHSQVREE